MTSFKCKKCNKLHNTQKESCFYCTSHENIFCLDCGFRYKCVGKKGDCFLNVIDDDAKFLKLIEIMVKDKIEIPVEAKVAFWQKVREMEHEE